MNPGAMALTVMPREANSRATDLRETDQPRLARRVIALARVADEADDRGNVDDAARNAA